MFKLFVCYIRLWLLFQSIWMILDFFLSYYTFFIMQRERGSMYILHSWLTRKVIILSKCVCLCNSTNFVNIFSACNSCCIKHFISTLVFLNRCSFIFIELKWDWSALTSDSFWCCSFSEVAFKTLHIRVLILVVKTCITWLREHYCAVGIPSWVYLGCHSSLISVLRHTEFRPFFLITKQRFS